MAKRSQQDSGEERVTAKSRPMTNLVARTPSLVSSSTSVSPGKEITEVKTHGVQLLKRTDRRPDKGTDLFEASWKASLQQVIQNWMTTALGLLKSGKLRLRRTIDQDDLIKLQGEW